MQQKKMQLFIKETQCGVNLINFYNINLCYRRHHTHTHTPEEIRVSPERREAAEMQPTSLYQVRLTDLHNPIAYEAGGGKRTGVSAVHDWEVHGAA